MVVHLTSFCYTQVIVLFLWTTFATFYSLSFFFFSIDATQVWKMSSAVIAACWSQHLAPAKTSVLMVAGCRDFSVLCWSGDGHVVHLSGSVHRSTQVSHKWADSSHFFTFHACNSIADCQESIKYHVVMKFLTDKAVNMFIVGYFDNLPDW